MRTNDFNKMVAEAYAIQSDGSGTLGASTKICRAELKESLIGLKLSDEQLELLAHNIEEQLFQTLHWLVHSDRLKERMLQLPRAHYQDSIDEDFLQFPRLAEAEWLKVHALFRDMMFYLINLSRNM
ncbi:hypothetical protein AB4254_10875 [Vibrio breoganii]